MPFGKRSDLKFVNVSTWDVVKEILQDSDGFITGIQDKFLTYSTKENIGRMLKVFETDEVGLFMVTRSPSTEIKLLPGEIGQASLTIADSYYGVPRVKYKTGQGEIHLFSYEVMPVSNNYLLDSLSRGYTATKDDRYLPSREDLHEVEEAFGSRVGMPTDWEKLYDQIVNGDLPKVSERPEVTDIKEGRKASGGRYKKSMQVRDFKYNISKGNL